MYSLSEYRVALFHKSTLAEINSRHMLPPACEAINRELARDCGLGWAVVTDKRDLRDNSLVRIVACTPVPFIRAYSCVHASQEWHGQANFH